MLYAITLTAVWLRRESVEHRQRSPSRCVRRVPQLSCSIRSALYATRSTDDETDAAGSQRCGAGGGGGSAGSAAGIGGHLPAGAAVAVGSAGAVGCDRHL